MALSFHPELAHLLAVGCYNGAVLVYDVHSPSEEPIYAANVRTGKHHDPVWDVFWQVGGGGGGGLDEGWGGQSGRWGTGGLGLLVELGWGFRCQPYKLSGFQGVNG